MEQQTKSLYKTKFDPPANPKGTLTEGPFNNESPPFNPSPFTFAIPAVGIFAVRIALRMGAGHPWGKTAFSNGTTGASAGGRIALTTAGGIRVAVGVAITLLSRGPANIELRRGGTCIRGVNFNNGRALRTILLTQAPRHALVAKIAAMNAANFIFLVVGCVL